MALATWHTLWHDEAATAAWAARLAAQPLLTQTYITLHGELGAGKTTLVRHVLRALGVQGRIKSPTYTVVEPYQVGSCAIWHFDFYRFNDPIEWEEAGFRDIFAASGLKLAEWPEKTAGLSPLADVAVYIQWLDEQQRCVTLHAYTPLGLTLLQGFFA